LEAAGKSVVAWLCSSGVDLPVAAFEQPGISLKNLREWLAFLNTVRTERFEQVLALRPLLLTVATAA
jgi:hypothetical protein